MKLNIIKTFIQRIFATINKIFDAIFWQPLRGGNGVTQPDELAKYTITMLGIYMVYREGISEVQLYTDTEFGIVFSAVVAITGVQSYFKKD
jgi:hypothetical protein